MIMVLICFLPFSFSNLDLPVLLLPIGTIMVLICFLPFLSANLDLPVDRLVTHWHDHDLLSAFSIFQP